MIPLDQIRDNFARIGALAIAERLCVDRGLTFARVWGGDRHKSYASSRREFWAILRASTDMSLPEIAALTGHDHTTVMSGVRLRESELARSYAPEAAAE